MKNIYSYLIATLALLVTGLLPGCSDDDINIIEQDTYIYCDLSSYTFDAEGEKGLTLEVKSSSEWQYSIADGIDWINVTQNDNNMTVEIDPNDTGDIRTAAITLNNRHENRFTFYLTQNFTIKDNDYSIFKIFQNTMIMSADGTYAAYVDSRIIDPIYYISQYTPVIINMKTGEITLCESNTEELEEASCISDTGVLATMKSWSLTARIYDVNDGKAMDIVEPGYLWSFIAAISSDASVMAGYVSTSTFFAPAKWVNGEMTILDYPKASIYGINIEGAGAVIRGGNKDLTILYGSDWAWGSYAPIVWNNGIPVGWGSEVVQELAVLEEVYDPFGQYQGTKEVDVVTGPRMTNDQFHMSADGKYVTCMHIDWERGEDGIGIRTEYPIVYNTVDNTVEVLKNIPECHGIHVNNDGVVFATNFVDLEQPGYVYDKSYAQVEATEDWMLRKYGIRVPSKSTVTYISNDGNTVLGQAYRFSVKTGGQHLYWIFRGNVTE